MGTGGPDKDRVIDALVLAISYSPIAEVSSRDALREMLRVEYHDMVDGSVFDMEQLWELLEPLPGFSPEGAKAPLALLKTWESRLGVEFQLPDAMTSMEDRDKQIASAQCRVPPAEMKLLFRMQTGEKPKDSPRAKRESMNAPRAKRESMNTSGVHAPSKRAVVKKRPAWMGIVAIVIALGGFSFAGYNGYQYCNPGPGDWDSFSASQVPGLPSKSAARLGATVSVEIDVGAWNRLDEGTRQTKLRGALLRNEDRGVKAIVLTSKGKRIATVQRTAGGDLAYWPPPGT